MTNNKITFVRVLRDCGFNKQIIDEGGNRGLIYDFDIMVDGVKRGEWRKYGLGRIGYDLVDAEREIVKVKRSETDSYAGRTIRPESQAEFDRLTREFMYALPTTEQLAERRRAREEESAAKERAAAEAERIHRIKEAGPELLEALLSLVYEENCRYFVGTVPDTDVTESVGLAIAKATGSAA